MSPEEFIRTFPNASKWQIEHNRLAFAEAVKTDWSKVPVSPAPFPEGMGGIKRRIRQDTKPLLNKLEDRALAYLHVKYPSLRFYAQSFRFRLANGLWYKPDLIAYVIEDPEQWAIAYEVKGPHAFRGGFENLKMAASVYPDIAWFLIWEDPPRSNNWLTQEVLP